MATKAPPNFTAFYKPGATPPVSGAPVLPPAFQQTGNWPDRDKVPATDSPEVKAWMKELDGHNIPGLNPTVDGSCASDAGSAADAVNRGWWTCGGPTRDTDIVACPDKYTWGVSFDDGPSLYTPVLLDYLKKKKIGATFFVVGSRVYERPAILIDEYMSGHEISVHTWSHRPLTSLTNEQIVAELGWTRKVIKTVLGVTPTTMRPPYGDIDDRVRAISLAMGMIPVLWSSTPSGTKFDTADWRVAGGGVNGTTSFDTFQQILNAASTLNTGFIVLEHDLFEITVDLAAGYFLDTAQNHNPKFNLQPVGQCMKIPATNLYLESNQNKTFPAPSAGGVDISGDGVIDTKSGDGGKTADSVKGAAFINAVPLMGSVALVGLGFVSLML
jgi:peptidoglycan/xylan/chitin deacetylase (PgdA/CDA1 family)